MSLNEEQESHLKSLNGMRRIDLCPCGWYSERECLSHCSTGNRNDPKALVRRIKEIYTQIDKHNLGV